MSFFEYIIQLYTFVEVYSVPYRPRLILVDRSRSLQIPDKVYLVPSRPKSKGYNCFIKFLGILHEIDFNH